MRWLAPWMALACGACSFVNSYEDPALVGDWKLTINEASQMSIDLDGEGEGTIAATVTLPDGSMVQGNIEYEIEWEQTAGTEFELVWTCQSSPAGCAGAFFIMECDASSDAEELDCLALGGGWSDPDFDWERD